MTNSERDNNQGSRATTDSIRKENRQTTDAGAETARINVETARQANASGANMVMEMAQRSVSNMANAWGFAGEENQETAQQASQSIRAIAECGTVLARGFQDISRELMSGAQDRFRQNLEGLGQLSRCRTPRDFFAVHSNLMRDYLESALSSSQRVSELSVGIAREATRKINASAEKTPS